MLQNVSSEEKEEKTKYIGLQDKYQKYNFIGEDCKAKCAKTLKLVQNVKSVTASTIESKFVLLIGCIVTA